jgi:hypothetical protein
MLKKFKNGGILALVLAAGMAVLQPASAQAAERHDRDGYHNQVRVDNRIRERGWDRGVRGREYARYYAPAPRYERRHYGYPSVAYPYYGYGVCPR